MTPLRCFTGFLLLFHLSEFLFVLWVHPDECGWAAWLFTPAYVGALSLSVAEHWLWHRRPHESVWERKALYWGVLVCVTGEIVRKSAMFTLRSAFTHRITRRRLKAHRLCTRGIYARCRHPAYLGWWLWAIGMQLLLGNRISTVVLLLIAWRFFQQRIAYEDALLQQMFGRAYARYWRRTPSGLPGIR